MRRIGQAPVRLLVIGNWKRKRGLAIGTGKWQLATEMTADIETELKTLMVETLMLEDVTPADIDSEAAIFGEGLGLDSIDALELALAISKKYGIRIKADDDKNREIFRSVRNLAAFVARETKLREGVR